MDEAVASFHKVLAIKPDYTEAHYNLGNALKHLGWVEGTVGSYRRALEIDPDYISKPITTWAWRCCSRATRKKDG